MSKEKFDLVVVAHPDDETFYFAGLIMAQRSRAWRVVCVTDGNADGDTLRRRKQFKRACKSLGVKHFEHWKFPDVYEDRLDIALLRDQLQHLCSQFGKPTRIFTHGIIGEYGHPHHQDISYAVHQTFGASKNVYTCAYNASPDMRVELNASEFRRKSKIIMSIYGSESQRFINLIPCTASEGFLRVSKKELEAVYDFFARGKALKVSALSHYRWLAKDLRQRRNMPRPF
jgi:LmbE family N-acetylglucosaminyl deacetylase